MVATPPKLPNIPTETWVKASWEDFITLADNPQYAEGRFYYDDGCMRIEMAALGSALGQDNSIVSMAIVLYAALHNLRIKEVLNTSFRKAGLRESQPDIGFYIGNSFRFPPRNNSPIDIDELAPPALAIEIAASSLSDDLGPKRLLYERMGVQEYWVVNVAQSEIIAFTVRDEGSSRIRESLVLPGLSVAVVEEALQRSASGR